MCEQLQVILKRNFLKSGNSPKICRIYMQFEIKHYREVIRNVLTMRRGSRSAGMMWEIP